MTVDPSAPRRNIVFHYLARLVFWLSGWRVAGSLPALRKYVIIIAPHTSHWDTFYFSAASCIFRLHGNYMIKASVFRGPVGWLLKKFGGIPVKRGEGARQNLVEQAIDAFHEHDYMVLVVAPEGTRTRRDHWRSGFYRIALGAGVPVQIVYADFAKKEVGAGPLLELSGDEASDLRKIRDFYQDVTPRHRDRFSPVRFRE